jgi:hypothetical protein
MKGVVICRVPFREEAKPQGRQRELTSWTKLTIKTAKLYVVFTGFKRI